MHLRANKRNVARRRLREAYRRLRPYVHGDLDVVFVGRRAILDAEWTDVLKEMIRLAAKAGLISDENSAAAREELGL